MKMNVRPTPIVAAIFLLAIAAGMPLHAAEIYKWVDENGVVHFSDNPPPPENQAAEKIAVEDSRPSDWDPEQDIYGVEEQAARMQAMREDMETKRQDRLERQRQQAAMQPQPQPREQERYGYPAITDQDREKIFGLNSARLYGVDVEATRKAMPADGLAAVKKTYRESGGERSDTAFGWVPA